MRVQPVCQQFQCFCRLIPITAVLVHINRGVQLVEHQNAVFCRLCYDSFTFTFFVQRLDELLLQLHVLQLLHRLVYITLFVKVKHFLHVVIEFTLINAGHRVGTVAQVVHDAVALLL